MIEIESLKDTDVGKRVVYYDKSSDKSEYGKITSWNSTFIFVDYDGSKRGKATRPEDLSFMDFESDKKSMVSSIMGFFSEDNIQNIKYKIRDEYKKNKVVGYEMKKNIIKTVKDLENGKVFDDDESADNAKGTIIDFVKITGLTAIFALPGGAAGIIVLRKFLKSKAAQSIGIAEILTLSVAEKGKPLKTVPFVPVGNHPGAFGFSRKHDVHTGVDLYCEPGEEVRAIECGEVVGIIDFTGTALGTTWWNDTRAVLVEGYSGVIVYGEIKEVDGLKIGDNVEVGDLLGHVVTVLKKDKGKPMTMLHVELYEHGFRADSPLASQNSKTMSWELGQPKPQFMLDPTPILLEIYDQK